MATLCYHGSGHDSSALDCVGTFILQSAASFWACLVWRNVSKLRMWTLIMLIVLYDCFTRSSGTLPEVLRLLFEAEKLRGLRCYTWLLIKCATPLKIFSWSTRSSKQSCIVIVYMWSSFSLLIMLIGELKSANWFIKLTGAFSLRYDFWLHGCICVFLSVRVLGWV